jgi:3-phenylpropionate/trans-cinnamate dioxygenase ferredoxin reductase subunit
MRTTDFAVVVVGAGQAGGQVAGALRENGHTGPVTLIGAEDAPPYQRPPLTKAFLAGTADESDLALRTGSYYEDRGIELLRGSRVTSIDRQAADVVLESGDRLRYDRLVLATGARPRRLPVPGADLPGVLTVRTVADARWLRRRLAEAGSARVVVVGGGFLGLELASVVRAQGHAVTVVEALPRMLPGKVSEPASAHLARVHFGHGVRLLPGVGVAAVHDAARGLAVELADGTLLPADFVVVSIGVVPDVELAADAGLATDNGVVVDEHLRTTDPVIYAVGDCVRFPDSRTGQALRLESVQNAVDQAGCVAATLGGTPTPYASLPWFWSNQYDIRLQIAGLADGSDSHVVAGDYAGGRFSVLCCVDGHVVGVESVNRPADFVIARRLLTAGVDLTHDMVAAPGFDLRTQTRGAA